MSFASNEFVMICRGIPGSRVENMQKADGAMLIINILEKGEESYG